MGLDNKVIFPDFKTTIIDKDNPTANYTREADGIINRIDGRSNVENGVLTNAGVLNSKTGKYDINISTSKDYTEGSIVSGKYEVYIDTQWSNYYIKNIPVKSSGKIVLKKDKQAGHCRVYYYTNTPGNGAGARIDDIDTKTESKSIIIPKDCTAITVHFTGRIKPPNFCYIQEGSEFIEYEQNATKTISIEQPLRQANNTVYDSIYKFTDGNYYLFKKVGNRPYQDGDLNNPDVTTDGVTTNYDLGRAGYTEVQLTNFDPNIKIFGTNTTFSCDSNMPSIELELPICYAYNESKRKYKDEVVDIDEVDIDGRKTTDIVSIEGQTFTNLLQEPLENGKVIIPVEMRGRECTYNGGLNTTVPLREIEGDTYINLLEDKIANATLKPAVSYGGEVVGGRNVVSRYKKEDLVVNNLNQSNGEILVDLNWFYIEQYIPILNGCTEILLDNIDVYRQVRVCFYTENNSYISGSTSAERKTYSITSIPATAKKIRFSCSMGVNGHLGSGMIQLVMDTTDYNLNNGDKVTIDEIKGNTKLYHESIPVLDASGNIFMSTLEDGWIDNLGVNTNNGFIRSGYFSAGDGVGNITFYAYNLNKELITLTQATNVTIRFYDKNTLTYKNSITTTLNRTGVAGISANNKGDLMRITFANNSGVTNQSLIMGKFNTVFNESEPYSDPIVIGAKTFPIQSVGELYVDEIGKPILDEVGNEQYKINIVSTNNLWDGKSWLKGRMSSGVLDYGYTSNEGLYDPYGVEFILTGSSMRGMTLDNIYINSNTYLYIYFNHEGWFTNSNGIGGIWFNWFDDNGVYISTTSINADMNNATGQGYIDSTNLTKSYFICKNIPENAKKSKICIWCNGGGQVRKILYNIQVVQRELPNINIKSVTEVKSIILPQPLRGIGGFKDRLYWDDSKGKYCISKKIKKFNLNSVVNNIYSNFDNNKDIPNYNCLFFGRQGMIDFSKFYSTMQCICDDISVSSQNPPNSSRWHLKLGNNDMRLAIMTSVFTSNEDAKNEYLEMSPNFYYNADNVEIIETNITEKITMSCYDNSTYIYTNGTSSHDEINLPAIENIKGELTVTTVPLSTTAYIKPNTKYTMFMDSDCDVNYNLGGLEGKVTYVLPTLWESGGLNATGGNNENSPNKRTNYINCGLNNTFLLYATKMAYAYMHCYDENKNWISNLYGGYINTEGKEFQLPQNAKFIRIQSPADNYEYISVLSYTQITNEKAMNVLTTPQTLTSNTLTLLGDGNIGNVTLLEGDYTNSYLPEKFINDVFAVGDLQDDGSYKVDIVSKNDTVNIFNEDMFRAIPPKQVIDGFDYYINDVSWGSTGTNSKFYISGSFKENQQYTFHYDVYNTSNSWANVIMVHTDGTEYISSYSNRFITSRPNKTLKSIYIVSGIMTSGVLGIGKVQIEEGVEISEYIKPVKTITSIHLPCRLLNYGGVKDRFYWDKSKGKMCVEKRVVEINQPVEPLGLNLSYIGTGDGYGEIHYTVQGVSDIKRNSRVICDKFVSFQNKYELLHVGNPNGIEGVVSDDGSNSVIIFSFNRNKVSDLSKDTISKWFIDNNIMIRAYIADTPKIIETNITQPINIDLFDTETVVGTTSTVNPNMHMRSDTLSRPVTIKPSTKYYVHAKTTGDVTVNLGGSEIQYVSSDIVKEITTPSSIKENIISFVGDCNISNVMLREDSRTDIKYFNGVIYASTLQSDGKYKTAINIMSSNSIDYDRTINIITTSPLESGTSIVVQNGVFKVLKADGSYEDIISTDGETSITSNCKKITASGEVNGIISIIAPYRSIRPLKAPINLSFNNYLDSDRHTFVWNTDVGVEGHKFYYKNELVGTVENPTPNFTYPSEMEGDVKVVAYNALTESEPLVQNITTLPNRTEIVDFDAKYLNDEYKITVKFNDNSNIKKGYKFIYSVDNGEKKTIDMPVTDNAVILSQSISAKDIADNAVISINTYNDVGEVEISPKTFYLTPTPKWTYLASSNKLMFRLIDKFNFRTNYNLVSKKNNASGGSQEVTEVMGTNGGVQGLLIDYLKDSNAEEELTVSVVMDDEKFTHIPCKPFNVSKTLDLSLVAPKNFTMEWVSEGVAKFSWDDNYINEEYFEFNYSLNNGLAENIKVYPEDVEGKGGRLSYTYNFAEYGSLTAKVRMVWELNSSEYSDTKTATFVAVTGLPPSWVVKRYDEDRLIISWEAQSYVDHYEVKIECDGKIELKNLVVDMFDLDLTKYGGKYVNIAIKTYYVTGVETEYSNSILFKPISNSNTISEMTYTPVEINKDDNISVYTKVYDRYVTYQKIMGSITNSNLINVKIFKENIRKDALMNMVFTHLVNEVYSDFVSIKTDNVSSGAYLHVLNYANIIKKGLLNTMIYTPIQNRLTDFMSVQRVTIVCIGDSITAG